MNFLAHLYLSDGTPDSMFGNMLADFVKGRTIDELPPAMRRAVLEHRRMDLFTDSHPRVIESVARLRPRWGRYSGILVDVFYDHFLAVDWESYSREPLRQFLDNVYAIYRENRPRFHACITGPMDRLIASDRLMTYTTHEGMEEALGRLSRVLTRQPELHRSVAELREFGAELSADFHAFFPDAILEMESVRRALAAQGSSGVTHVANDVSQ